MRSGMIAFCIGIALVAQFPMLPEPLLFWLGGAGLLLCRRIMPAKFIVFLFAAVVFGMGWGTTVGASHVDAVLPDYLEGEDFWLIGKVADLPQQSDRAQQFAFEVERSCFALLPQDCTQGSALFNNRLVRLNYYGSNSMVPSQRWLLRVRLNKPHGFANPGGFDYEAWLTQQGFSAKGYVRENSFNERLEDGRITLALLRYRMRKKLQEATAEFSNAGIILALVLGVRDQVSLDDWTLFTETGTNHLIVISGLHIGFIAVLCFWIADRLVRFFPSLLLRIPAQKLAAIAAVTGAFFYSLLAGFSVPTQRAFIMVLVFMIGKILARNYPVSFAYCVALTLVLIVNPMSVTGAGFWLSFGAVGTLLLAFGGTLRLHVSASDEPSVADERWSFCRFSNALWRRWGLPQWIVFVGMTVPLAMWMQQLSLLSPLANIVAIPVVSLLVVPMSLAGAAVLWVYEPLGTLILQAADEFLTLLMWGLQQLTTFESDVLIWQFFGLNWASYCGAAAGTLLLLLPRGWPYRWLALVLFLPLLFPVRSAIDDGLVEITVLDVGQGLAMVVQTATHVLVYDTGPQFSESFDTGEGVVFPYLRQLGVRQIDHVIVSHADNDHAGGLKSLLALLPVHKLSASLLPAADNQPSDSQLCQRGQHWVWDGVEFQILAPTVEMPYRGNDSSCVLLISAKGQRALLPGDIEARAEVTLLAEYGDALVSAVLIAPHHGSNTSSTQALLDAVKPRYVIYSAGYRSQFGHPTAAVVARYWAIESWPLNTALSGAIRFCLGESMLEAPQEYRRSQRRYWYPAISTDSAILHGVGTEFSTLSRQPNDGKSCSRHGGRVW